MRKDRNRRYEQRLGGEGRGSSQAVIWPQEKTDRAVDAVTFVSEIARDLRAAPKESHAERGLKGRPERATSI